MKNDIHPQTKEIAFKDVSTGDVFIAHSTLAGKGNIEIEGKTYPLVELEISSASHPFFTGTQKLVDTAGRIERFKKRFKLNS